MENLEELITEGTPFLYRGVNDYRKILIGPQNPAFVPSSSNWSGGGAIGEGLYLTTDLNTARSYAIGYADTLYKGGKGCSHKIFILALSLGNNFENYKSVKGICLREKNKYNDKQEYWNTSISNPDISFIVNIDGDGTEICFFRNPNNLIHYLMNFKEEPMDYDENICNRSFNKVPPSYRVEQSIIDEYPHDCITNTRITCPTSCQYLKNVGKLPKNRDGTQIDCGTDQYKQKYVKYKNKYLQLKNKFGK